MRNSIVLKTVLAVLINCLASGSIQAITWGDHLKKHGIANGVLCLSSNLGRGDCKSIGELESITVLVFDQNLQETVPEETREISDMLFALFNDKHPTDIGQLTNLKRLCIWHNFFFGDGVGLEALRMLGVQALYIVFGSLKSLTDKIGQFANLKELDIRTNNQLKLLPAKIGQLKKLKKLDLSNNQLESLSVEIGQLRKLEVLNLRGNKLQSLPPEVGQLTNLKELDIQANNFQSLPPTFSQLQGRKSDCSNISTGRIQNSQGSLVGRSVVDRDRYRRVMEAGAKMRRLRQSLLLGQLQDSRVRFDVSISDIEKLQKRYVHNLTAFILQATRQNNLVNVRKFTRSILDRCELKPTIFKDEHGNNLVHLAVMYHDQARDPEWKILKELIARNINDSAVTMLQEKNNQGAMPLQLLLQNDGSLAMFKKIMEITSKKRKHEEIEEN